MFVRACVCLCVCLCVCVCACQCVCVSVCLCVQKLPAPIAARIVYQVCCGVKQLHDEGVCHRDIRTANVMVKSKDPHVKLADFGFSCLLPRAQPEAVASAGIVCVLLLMCITMTGTNTCL